MSLPELAQIAPILFVVAFAAVVQYATGFGFALVSVPLLALVMDAHAAVLTALLLGMLGNFTQAIEGRRVVHRAVVGRLVVTALLGMPVGWWVFTHADARLLQLTIGVVILIAVVALARGFTLHHTSAGVDLGVGALAGFLTTCTGTNGPPIVALLHARRVPPAAFRATTTTTFLAVDIIAVIAYAVSGHLTLSHVVTTLLTVPALALGALVGIRARRLLSPGTFRVIVLVLLSVTGVIAIVTAR